MSDGKKHSKLGASSSHRWWHCPGSVKACESLPNVSSPEAQEGSCAHAVAEYCLNSGQDAAVMIDRPVKEYPDIDVTEEMTEAVQVYLDTVRADMAKMPDAEMSVETKFDLSHIHPQMFGTNDACLYSPSLAKIIIYDYKHGKGRPVEVEGNPQIMYYAVGALTGKHNRPIHDIELVIVQPRCPHHDGPIRRWKTDPVSLMDWIDDLQQAAKRTEAKNAPLVAGSWCRESFCPNAGQCETLAKFVLDAARADFAVDGSVIVSEPSTYSPQAVADALDRADVIEHWVKSVRAYAHGEAEAGRIPPGYALFQKRAHRKHQSEENTVNALFDYCVSRAAITTPGKLMSPAQVEAYMKKKGVKPEELAGLFYTPEIGSTLAPITDKRKRVKPEATSEFMES